MNIDLLELGAGGLKLLVLSEIQGTDLCKFEFSQHPIEKWKL